MCTAKTVAAVGFARLGDKLLDLSKTALEGGGELGSIVMLTFVIYECTLTELRRYSCLIQRFNSQTWESLCIYLLKNTKFAPSLRRRHFRLKIGPPLTAEKEK